MDRQRRIVAANLGRKVGRPGPELTHLYVFFRKTFRQQNKPSSRIVLEPEREPPCAVRNRHDSELRTDNAGSDDVVLHSGFLRLGVSLRQSMPEVEVAHGFIYSDRADSCHCHSRSPDILVTLPGEALT